MIRRAGRDSGGATGPLHGASPKLDTSSETPGSVGGSADATGDDQAFFCDLCGARMLNVHCKLSCPRCGYKRDCSDP